MKTRVVVVVVVCDNESHGLSWGRFKPRQLGLGPAARVIFRTIMAMCLGRWSWLVSSASNK